MPAGYRLLNARPLRVTAEEQTFSGVISDIPDPDDPDPPPPVHHFTMRIEGEWRVLSALPATVLDRDKVHWATGVYGDDPLVKDMGSTPAQPVALPQVPVLPYAQYAALIP